MVFLKQSDNFEVSIKESHSLKEGEKSTLVKSTIVSTTLRFLFFENVNLSHEVQKRTKIKTATTRIYLKI